MAVVCGRVCSLTPRRTNVCACVAKGFILCKKNRLSTSLERVVGSYLYLTFGYCRCNCTVHSKGCLLYMCVCVCMYIYMYVCVCMYVYMYVCMYGI